MITKEYIITAAQGIHARPAATLIRLAKKFKSSISIKKGDKIVTLNSMLNLLSMAIKGGDSIAILVEGEDEAGAIVAIDQFFTEQLKDL